MRTFALLLTLPLAAMAADPRPSTFAELAHADVGISMAYGSPRPPRELLAAYGLADLDARVVAVVAGELQRQGLPDGTAWAFEELPAEKQAMAEAMVAALASTLRGLELEDPEVLEDFDFQVSTGEVWDERRGDYRPVAVPQLTDDSGDADREAAKAIEILRDALVGRVRRLRRENDLPGRRDPEVAARVARYQAWLERVAPGALASTTTRASGATSGGGLFGL